MAVYWLSSDALFKMAKKQINPAGIVLDIGCGIRPQNLIKPIVHICCEPFDQYVKALNEKIENSHDRSYVIIKAAWSDAVHLFPKKSVDTVFLLDVIEHLEKREARILLKETIEIAKKQVVLFTPLGFFPQSHSDGKDAWGLNGGAWQEHKSGWGPEDFDDSWNIYAAKEFHFKDYKGEFFERPYGAFFAILNNNSENIQKKNTALSRRHKTHRILDRAIDSMEVVCHALH